MKKAEEIFKLDVLASGCREAMWNIEANPDDYRGEFGEDYASYTVCVIASEYNGIHIPFAVAQIFGMTPTDFDDDLVYDEDRDVWVDLQDSSVWFDDEEMAIASCDGIYDTIEDAGNELSLQLQQYLTENHPDIPGYVLIGFDHNGAFSVIYYQEIPEEEEE